MSPHIKFPAILVLVGSLALAGCSGDDVATVDEQPVSDPNAPPSSPNSPKTPSSPSSPSSPAPASTHPKEISISGFGCTTAEKIENPCSDSKVIKAKCKIEDEEDGTEVKLKIKCANGKYFHYKWKNGVLENDDD